MNDVLHNTVEPQTSLSGRDAALYEHLRMLRREIGDPLLLLGQRYITTASALRRAKYISNLCREPGSRVLFLGDDDLVSAVLGNMRPDLQMTVLDLDVRLLRALEDDSRKRGYRLSLQHADLFGRSLPEIPSSLVVLDPYPTADASFEVAFLESGMKIAGKGATALMTYAPTHKWIGFGSIVRRKLQTLGYSCESTDLSVEYDAIPDELTTLERVRLAAVDVQGTAISHCKQHIIVRGSSRELSHQFDADAWRKTVYRHELIAQTGGIGRVRAELKSIHGTEACRSDHHMPDQFGPFQIDVTPILRDVVRTVGRNVTGAIAEEIAYVESLSDNCQPNADKEMELVVLARMYESYSRGGGEPRNVHYA